MKKNNIRIISILISLVMFVSIWFPLSIYAERTNEIDVDNARLLSAIGVNVNTDAATVTRGAFAKYLYEAMNLDNITYDGTMPYSDVLPKDDCYNAVGVLYELGVVSLDTSFNPTNIITSSEIAKMIVSAYGYAQVAEAKGGYPVGYTMCAKQMGISIGADEQINGKSVVSILYDMLLACPSPVKDINIQKDIADGFEVYHNLRSVVGVITSNEMSTIYQDVAMAKNGYVTINGKPFEYSEGLTDGKLSINDYLGYTIEAYVFDYGSSNEKIVYFNTNDNEILQFNTEDVEKNGFVLNVYQNDKVKKYNLSHGSSVIYNGMICDDFTDADFESIDGTLTMVDNDDNGNFDIIKIEKPEYLVTKSFNAGAGWISDKNRHTYGKNNDIIINLDNNDCIYEYYVQDGEKLNSVGIEKLEGYEAFSVMMSRDEKFIRLIAISNRISGTITSYSETDNEIFIDDKPYKKTEYADLHNKHLKAGVYIEGYITHDGKLIYAESNETNMRYAFIMGISTDGPFNDCIAYVLFEDGRKEAVKFKNRIMLDGESTKVDFANSSNIVYSTFYKKPQLIKVSLNKAGEIACIDTAAAAPNFRDLYTADLDTDPIDNLLHHTDIDSVGKRSVNYTTLFTPSIVPRTMKVFSVPEVIKTPSGAANYVLDAEDFEVVSIDEIDTDNKASVAVYDIAKNRDAGAMVWYNPNTEGGIAPIGRYATVAMIDSVTLALNEEGTPTTKISYATVNRDSTGIEPEFRIGYFSEELQNQYKDGEYELGSGDFATIAVSGNTINNINPLISYREWKAIDPNLYIDIAHGAETEFVAKGTIIDFSDSVLTVLIDDSDPSDGVDDSGIMAYPFMNFSLLVKYDDAIDGFKKVKVSELKTVYNSGFDNADRILIKTDSYEIFAIAAYPAAQQ